MNEGTSHRLPGIMPPVFRFAPSPNGYLHLGHALSALLNADMARASAGRLLLRIEDIDTVRCRPEYEAAIYEDLSWIGLKWETPVWRQSSRWDNYRAALSQLEAMGLIYASFETRAEIARLVAVREVHGPWPCDPDGAPLYPGEARNMPEAEQKRRIESGEPYALRLDMRTAAARAGDASVWGDVILARKETPTSYHLAVALDDAAQGITDVVRGRDLFYATAVHRLLQALLGLPQPRYHHHKLLLGPDGGKLSKSTQSTGLRELRARGASPAEIRRLAGID
jgi:glutamyl-Q tRNA(Asp) synthetase